MGRPVIGTLAMLAVVGSALAACSKDEGPSAPLPTSAFPDETGALPPLTGPNGVTSIPPAGTTGSLSSGRATVTVSGDVRASKTMSNLVAGAYAAPPGGMAVVWTAGGTDATTLGLGGLSFTGTQSTAATLSLTLTVQTNGEISSFVSTAGECSITIDLASASELSGTFMCSGLFGSAGEVVGA